MDRLLVDTNVLVYSFDPADHRKRERAAALLNDLVTTDRGVLSAQCLSEFFNASTKRLRPPLTRAEARDRVDEFAGTFPVLDVSEAVVLEACRGSAEHELSIWDAMIWACAKLNQVPYVLTEDAPHGRRLESVTFLDPFDPTFVLPA